jgi:hypothetical protein
LAAASSAVPAASSSPPPHRHERRRQRRERPLVRRLQDGRGIVEPAPLEEQQRGASPEIRTVRACETQPAARVDAAQGGRQGVVGITRQPMQVDEQVIRGRLGG